MDFNVSHRFKNNGSLLTDSLFYLVAAVLIFVIFYYAIFAFNVYLQNKKIDEVDKKIAALNTSQLQKGAENEVFYYKKKIDDFTTIISNHRISSNIFSFIEKKTLPNVWFSSFDMLESNNNLKLTGESENMGTLSRQVQVFEQSEGYIKDTSVLSSQVGPTGKVKFTINLSLDPQIFTYKNPVINQ